MTNSTTCPSSSSTPDAPPASFVDRLPPRLQPWFRLIRADRPIGTWLLVIPCWWGMALAYADGAGGANTIGQLLYYAILFAIGAFVMRGAGCAYNDIVDHDIDAKVARTANRPLPGGHLTMIEAWLVVIILSLIGLAILLSFNRTAIVTGLASLVLVAIYPFMKRITLFPQIWLGMTFNWGVLVGYVAVNGHFSLSVLILYLAAILWTVGYDTIYAHQDKEDDAMIGIGSTALAFGAQSDRWLLRLYSLMLGSLVWLGLVSPLGPWYFLGLVAIALHLFWQIWRVEFDQAAICLAIFKSNRETGLMVLVALILGQL
ncbi:MAG: 4-hydroxybenzoate octaprenyltransferase [bacterium]